MLKNDEYKKSDVKTWDDVGLLEGLDNNDKVYLANNLSKTYKLLETKRKHLDFLSVAMFPIVKRIFDGTKKTDLDIKYIYDKFNKHYKRNYTKIVELNIIGADGEAEMIHEFTNIMIEEINNKKYKLKSNGKRRN